MDMNRRAESATPANDPAASKPTPGVEQRGASDRRGTGIAEAIAAAPRREGARHHDGTSPTLGGSATPPSRVRLTIDELNLHGFPVSDRYRIGEAVERELARLMETEGVPPGIAAGAALDRIDAGAIQLAGASKPAEVGARIARAIYGGLRR